MPAKKTKGFSAAEKAALKERARELKAQARAAANRAEGERAVAAAIAKMPDADRSLGEQVHAIIAANAPDLWPRLWYGMPAYANPPAPAGDGKVVCFFQAASKFKTRYATLAFTDSSNLDHGIKSGVWPTGFGVRALSAADREALAALVRRAVSISTRA